MRSALLCFPLLFPMRYTALRCTALLASPPLSSPLLTSPSLLHLSLFFLFLYLHPSHTTRSYLCCALLRSAPLFGKIQCTLGFFASERSTLQLLVEEDSDAPGAPGLAYIGLFGSEGEGREGGESGQRAAQVRASSACGSKSSKVVAVVLDGFPSMVMPWDLRAFRQLELETFSHFSPPSGAALILVPGKATGHQWLHREEWAPWTSWTHHDHSTGPSENCAMQPSYHLYACWR